jgi:hypothetical protein
VRLAKSSGCTAPSLVDTAMWLASGDRARRRQSHERAASLSRGDNLEGCRHRVPTICQNPVGPVDNCVISTVAEATPAKIGLADRCRRPMMPSQDSACVGTAGARRLRKMLLIRATGRHSSGAAGVAPLRRHSQWVNSIGTLANSRIDVVHTRRALQGSGRPMAHW